MHIHLKQINERIYILTGENVLMGAWGHYCLSHNANWGWQYICNAFFSVVVSAIHVTDSWDMLSVYTVVFSILYVHCYISYRANDKWKKRFGWALGRGQHCLQRWTSWMGWQQKTFTVTMPWPSSCNLLYISHRFFALESVRPLLVCYLSAQFLNHLTTRSLTSIFSSHQQWQM